LRIAEKDKPMDDHKKTCTACGNVGMGGLTKLGSPKQPKAGFGGWQTAPIEEVAMWDPVIALARAMGAQFVPFMLNIRTSFVDNDELISNTVSFEGSNERLNMVSVVDEVTYQIDTPNLNPGNALQAVNAWFYARQSGIQATLIVDGAPRYVVAPFFTPLESLASSLAEGWPMGWSLGYTQTMKMQFKATIPIPALPANVTVTMRAWQPSAGNTFFVGMTDPVARSLLTRLGYNVPIVSQDTLSTIPTSSNT
jgi:hypothetical protein